MIAETAQPGLAPPPWRTRAWGIAGALSITETISWGILYYAFAVFLLPMQRELGYSAAQLTGAFSLALLVSAVAGIAVGRHLDRHSPRTLMTAGSVAGVLLVLAWSQVHGLLGFYALWIGIGLVMAAVLYEPAFTVLAKWFPGSAERRRAMTAMTLAGALASFIFLPLAQGLIDAYGWRDALLALAVILALGTVPLHAVALRKAPRVDPAEHPHPSMSAGEALRSTSFWLLSGAFFLATGAAIAVTVQGIPFLLERGYSPAFAAFSIGVIGVSQIPGRLLFAPLAERLPHPWRTVALFALISAGIGLIVGVDTTPAVITGMMLLGHGQRHGHAGEGDRDRRSLRLRRVRDDRQRRGRGDHRRARRRPGAGRRLCRRRGLPRAADHARRDRVSRRVAGLWSGAARSGCILFRGRASLET